MFMSFPPWFLKLIVVEGAGVLLYEGRGLCGRGRALKISHQSAGARRRRESRQSKCPYVASGAEICAQLDKREKWCPNGAQNNRDITCWVFSLTWITEGNTIFSRIAPFMSEFGYSR